MKKILVIMLASLALFNSSCKKDNGEEIAPLANGKPIGTEEISLYPPPGHYDQIAGNAFAAAGSANGNRFNARFDRPMGICVASGGSLLVADEGNSVIRKITHDTVVTTLSLSHVKHGESFVGGGGQLGYGPYPYGVAETKDGTIGIVGYTGSYEAHGGDEDNYYGLWIFKPDGQPFGYELEDLASFDWSLQQGDGYRGIDKDFSSDSFWYTGSTGVGTITSNGTGLTSANAIANRPGGYQFEFGAISSCSNGVKYFTDGHLMYKMTKSGVQSQIFTSLTFTHITGIAAITGGDKIYIADGGDIKMINNCSNCIPTLTTIVSGPEAEGIALANSQKFLYFTSDFNTVNKLTLWQTFEI